ncbi:MAG: hypothetical protein WD904_11125 [Dehalococcoidia bacterium]
MRKRSLALVVMLTLCVIATVGLLAVSITSADKGGCPNSAAANGYLHANQNSAFYKHCDTP